MELTILGLEVKKSIEYIDSNDAGIEIPAYVIMPNHVHMIIELSSTEHVGPGFHPRPPTALQSVVGRIKSYTVKRWNEANATKYQTFWQSGFYDHIIRNEDDYHLTWKYIDDNPAKWPNDKYYI